MKLKPVPLLFALCWLLFVSQTPPSDPPAERDKADLLTDSLQNDRQRAAWNDLVRHAVGVAIELNPQKAYKRTDSLLAYALDGLRTAGRADSLGSAKLWLWRALNYRRQQRWPDALAGYQEALRVYALHHALGNDPAFCYKNAAQIYVRRMEYAEANTYLEAAMRVDTAGKNRQSIYTQLSNNFFWQDSLDAAWRCYQQALTVPSQGAFYDASLATAGAAVLLKRRQFAESEALYRQALRVFSQSPDDAEHALRCHTALADIAAQTGRPAQAGAHYRQAEALGKEMYKGKSREMAKLYTEWGDFCRRNKQPDRALACYQAAMIQAWPDFDSSDPAQNPDPAGAPLELWAMNAPARKAALLLENPGPAGRENATRCFESAFAAAERLRLAYGKDEAKLYLQQNNYDLYREAARNLLALYEQQPEEKTLDRLFDLLEAGRAAVLRDALREQRALAGAGLPDSLLHREAMLRLDLAAMDREMAVLQAAGDSVRLLSLRADRTALELEYTGYLQRLERQSPRYAAYRRAGDALPTAALRDALPDTAALLTWFDAGDRYLCLALRRGGIRLHTVPVDTAFVARLGRFQQLLADRNAQQSHPAVFFNLASALYTDLLPPGSITGADRQLVVIPDGRLCYLPFEALLTRPHAGRYADAPWLLHAHTVRYGWSASLLARQVAPGRQKQTGILHVAPFVSDARDGLAVLPNALSEAPHDRLLKNQSAGADAFLQAAPAYNVVHLSTHAGLLPDGRPGIELADRALLLPEIYAARLQASLVALSACETGLGRLAQGEGVLSLARAFAYAGAHSLLASLWQVNDAATARLFTAFYQKLGEKRAKSEALRAAKLEYLQSDAPDALKAPWYWAGFTLTGEDGATDMPGTWGGNWGWYLLGGLVLLLGLGWFFRRAFLRTKALSE